MRGAALLLMGLGLAGCAATPLPDHARVYPGAFTGGFASDEDVAAINIASWALALSSNTRNRPIDAARAAAAVDYLAGELSYSPRWQAMSPITKIQMLQARTEMRATLGIAPDAPSQIVVDTLLRAANALQLNDRAAALRLLTGPAFTSGPDQTLATLQALPFLPTANVATQHASAEAQPLSYGPS